MKEIFGRRPSATGELSLQAHFVVNTLHYKDRDFAKKKLLYIDWDYCLIIISARKGAQAKVFFEEEGLRSGI